MYRKEVIYEDEDYKISMEEIETELFFHVGFYKFDRKVWDKALRQWAEIKAKCYWLGYQAVYTYTPNPKMKKLFPFSTVVNTYDYKGKEYEVLKWELN